MYLYQWSNEKKIFKVFTPLAGLEPEIPNYNARYTEPYIT